MSNTRSIDMKVEYDNRLIANMSCTKLLGVIIEKYVILGKSYRSTFT